MSRLADRIIDLPLTADIDEAVRGALRIAGGDPETAIRALILGQRSLMEAYAGAISAGYIRQELLAA